MVLPKIEDDRLSLESKMQWGKEQNSLIPFRRRGEMNVVVDIFYERI